MKQHGIEKWEWGLLPWTANLVPPRLLQEQCVYKLPKWSDCCLGSTAEVACEMEAVCPGPTTYKTLSGQGAWSRYKGCQFVEPKQRPSGLAGRGGQAILKARAMGWNHKDGPEEGVRKPVVLAENTTELYHNETGTADGLRDLAGPTRTLSREGDGGTTGAWPPASCSRRDGIP